MAFRLSERLSAVADMVTVGARLCDVGCDHAYLPIALARDGRIASAIAMDAREGPLAIARENVYREGLADVITLRLSDGLERLSPDEADAIVLAGMGGMLMLDILERGIAVARTASEWILQPQSDVRTVRQWLRRNEAVIVDEEMVCERGKYYPIIKARPRGVKVQWLQESYLDTEQSDLRRLEIGGRGRQFDRNTGRDGTLVDKTSISMELCDAFGAILLAKRHPVLRYFLEEERMRICGILERMSAESPNLVQSKRQQELEAELALTEEGLRVVSVR